MRLLATNMLAANSASAAEFEAQHSSMLAATGGRPADSPAYLTAINSADDDSVGRIR